MQKDFEQHFHTPTKVQCNSRVMSTNSRVMSTHSKMMQYQSNAPNEKKPPGRRSEEPKSPLEQSKKQDTTESEEDPYKAGLYSESPAGFILNKPTNPSSEEQKSNANTMHYMPVTPICKKSNDRKGSERTLKTQMATPPVKKPSATLLTAKAATTSKAVKQESDAPAGNRKESIAARLRTRLSSKWSGKQRKDSIRRSEIGGNESVYSGSVNLGQIHASLKRSDISNAPVPNKQKKVFSIRTSEKEFHPLQIQRNIERKNSISR